MLYGGKSSSKYKCRHCRRLLVITTGGAVICPHCDGRKFWPEKKHT